MICIIRIDYDEGKPETYRGVVVSSKDEPQPRVWYSGDVVKDWMAAIRFARENYFLVLTSSSVDAFCDEAEIALN